MRYHARRELLVRVAPRYQEARGAQKPRILDEFVATTGYARKDAIRLLQGPVRAPAPIQRVRTPRYGPAVRDYKAHLQTVEGKKPGTVNRRLAGLRKFFAWAHARRLVAESPTTGVRGMGAVALSPKALEKREVEKLVRTVQRHGSKRDVAIIQLLRHTGLRAGELCALNLTDVVISERKGQVVVRSGKGRKYRAVPLNAEVRAALDAYLKVRPDVASPALFINQRKDRLGHTAVAGVVAKYAQLAGLEEVTPHTLRHTFGKSALDAGANLVAVAALLGHADLKTTAIYTQPTVRDLEDAVRRLETATR